MAGSRPRQNDAEPQESPARPPVPYSGHNDHSFTLQAIMDIQKSIGLLSAKIDNIDSTVQSTKSKVEDLVNWKHRILGGAMVMGAVIAVVTFGITKFSDYVTITPPVKSAVTQPPK